MKRPAPDFSLTAVYLVGGDSITAEWTQGDAPIMCAVPDIISKRNGSLIVALTVNADADVPSAERRAGFLPSWRGAPLLRNPLSET